MPMGRAFAQAVMAAALGAAGALSACITDPARVTDATLQQRLATASTPAEHAALATYFKEQARDAEDKAAARRAARRHYAHTPASIFYPIGTAPAILEHYDRLIAGYEQAALENRELSQWHQRLADAQTPRPGED